MSQQLLRMGLSKATTFKTTYWCFPFCKEMQLIHDSFKLMWTLHKAQAYFVYLSQKWWHTCLYIAKEKDMNWWNEDAYWWTTVCTPKNWITASLTIVSTTTGWVSLGWVGVSQMTPYWPQRGPVLDIKSCHRVLIRCARVEQKKPNNSKSQWMQNMCQRV